MNAALAMSTPRALARGLQALLLAGSLAAGAGLGHHVAHACSLTVGAFAENNVLKAWGSCFPFPSDVHLKIGDHSTGVVLLNWTTIPVTSVPGNPPGFSYVTQGDAREGDTIIFHIVDGAIDQFVTVID